MSDLRVLIIDDLRIARNDPNAVYARTPDEGLKMLEQDWDFIMLDHDLGIGPGGEDLTIWPCIEYIIANRERFRDVIIDIISANPVGAQRMQNALEPFIDSAIPIWSEEAKRREFDYLPWEDMWGY